MGIIMPHLGISVNGSQGGASQVTDADGAHSTRAGMDFAPSRAAVGGAVCRLAASRLNRRGRQWEAQSRFSNSKTLRLGGRVATDSITPSIVSLAILKVN